MKITEKQNLLTQVEEKDSATHPGVNNHECACSVIHVLEKC